MQDASPPPTGPGARDPEHRRRALFREVNERIRDFAAAGGRLTTDEFEILCECGRLDCFEHVAVTLELYDEARNGGRGFVVAAGHERSESVLTELPAGSVVRHRGVQAPLAQTRS